MDFPMINSKIKILNKKCVVSLHSWQLFMIIEKWWRLIYVYIYRK